MALLPDDVLKKYLGTGYAPEGMTYASAALSHGDPLAPGLMPQDMMGAINQVAPARSAPDTFRPSPYDPGGPLDMGRGSLFERFMGLNQPPKMTQTVQWLVEDQGVDPGTAMLMVRDPDMLKSFISERRKASQPIEVNGQLVNPQTGAVIGDYRTPPKPEGPISVGKDSQLWDPGTRQWITPPDGGQPDKPDFGDVAGMRKEITALPSYKNYSQAAPIWSSLVDAEGRDTKASDLNFVYGIGKLFDPGSVVREGEMVMVQGASSLPQRILSAINIVNERGRLTPDMRKELLAEAQSRMNAYDAAVRTDMRGYRGIARRYGINPRDILPRLAPLPKWGGATPPATEGHTGTGGGSAVDSLTLQPGAVIAGDDGLSYEFTGGNPRDRKNWRRIDDPGISGTP